MNSEDSTKLTALIGQLWPSMRIGDFTADAWHPAVADIQLDDAVAAVYALVKARSGYISVYDIRRQVAQTAGLLAPDEANALILATAVAGNMGTGSRILPPAVQAAYWAMGGSQGFAAPPQILRPQWGKVYRNCVEEAERELLAGDLGAAVARAAIDRGSGRVPAVSPATSTFE